MKAEHVKDSLSAYLDGLLSEEERRQVEEHLAGCTECSGALDELTKTLSLLNDLEDVEPPAWFTQKVMSTVREEAGSRQGFVRRLLAPIHSFIPLEALGALAIAITMIVLLRGMLPDMVKTYKEEAPKPPSSAPAEQFNRMKEMPPEPQPLAEAKKDITKAPLPSARVQSPTGALGGGKGYAPAVDRDKIGILEDRATPVGKAEEESVRAMKMKEGAALRSAPAEPSTVEEHMEQGLRPSMAASPRAQPMQERALIMTEEEVETAAKPVPPPLKKKIAAEREKRLIRVHLSVLSIDTVEKEIEEITRLAGGKIIKTRHDKDKMVISLTIQSEKSTFFIEKLGMMGEITKKKMPSVKMKDNVEVVIEIQRKIIE